MARCLGSARYGCWRPAASSVGDPVGRCPRQERDHEHRQPSGPHQRGRPDTHRGDVDRARLTARTRRIHKQSKFYESAPQTPPHPNAVAMAAPATVPTAAHAHCRIRAPLSLHNDNERARRRIRPTSCRWRRVRFCRTAREEVGHQDGQQDQPLQASNLLPGVATVLESMSTWSRGDTS